MKTACPHCNQEYDVDDSFLTKEAACRVCQKKFVIKPVKFCSSCGTVNAADNWNCRKCNRDFIPGIKKPQRPRVSDSERVAEINKLTKENRRLNSKLKTRGSRKFIWIFSIIFILLVSAFCGLAWGKYYLDEFADNQRIICYNSFCRLSNAIINYSEEYHQLPADLNLLAHKELPDWEKCLCPVKNEFVFIGHGVDTTITPDYFPVMFEMPGTHVDGKICLLFLSGEVRMIELPPELKSKAEIARFIFTEYAPDIHKEMYRAVFRLRDEARQLEYRKELADEAEHEADTSMFSVKARLEMQKRLDAIPFFKRLSFYRPRIESIDSKLKAAQAQDIVFSKDGKVLIECRDEQIVRVVIPDCVEVIAPRAFDNCTFLNRVVIPDSVTTIGESAFFNCRNLRSIAVPGSVTRIGKSAFGWCHNLAQVHLGYGVERLEAGVFNDCNNLVSINIPGSVKYIGPYAFFSCDKLGGVSLPGGIEKIGAYAFADCPNLSSRVVSGSSDSITEEFPNYPIPGVNVKISVGQ